MLENYLRNPISTNEQQEAMLLLKELSCLPLAIVQAAAYINASETTITDYRSLLAQEKQVTKLSSEGSEDKLRYCSTNHPVAMTWLISFEKMRRNNPLVADCLFFMASIDRKDIPIDLLPAPSSRERKDVVRTLSDYALVTKRPAETSIDLHRLLHLAICNWLQKQEWLGEWNQKAIIRLVEVFPDEYLESRSKWRRLRPHARYALSYGITAQEDKARTNLAWKCATTLHSDGRYNESEELFVRVVETRKRVLGEEHPDTLTSMSNLASTYRYQGRWKDAEELFMRVMATFERVLGEEHPDTLTSMNNLALTYSNQDRWKEANELIMRVTETRKRVLGEEHPDKLASMGNLALIYKNQDQWKETEELKIRVMETRKRVLGEEHPDTLTGMSNLASTYMNQGRWKEAEEIEVRVMETRKRVLGEEHPDTLTSMNNLACTLKSCGRDADALTLIVECQRLLQLTLGDSHPNTLVCSQTVKDWTSK